jgi:hypothetical protein
MRYAILILVAVGLSACATKPAKPRKVDTAAVANVLEGQGKTLQELREELLKLKAQEANQ